VTATIDLRFGDATSLAGETRRGLVAGAMLMAGTTTHTRQQLPTNSQTECAGHRQRGRRRWGWRTRRRRRWRRWRGLVERDGQHFGAGGELAAAMALAVEILKHPLYPQDEFDR